MEPGEALAAPPPAPVFFLARLRCRRVVSLTPSPPTHTTFAHHLVGLGSYQCHWIRFPDYIGAHGHA